MTVTAQVRMAIKQAPSKRALARKSDVCLATIKRFANQGRPVNCTTLDKLVDALGLEVRVSRKKGTDDV